MQPHSRRGSKWQRFNRKYGVLMFVVFCIVAAVALVALLMWMLTDMSCRPRF
jgi:hypothetical protein